MKACKNVKNESKKNECEKNFCKKRLHHPGLQMEQYKES